MATFPRLKTGALAQYPSARKLSFATSITRFVDGAEQRFREFEDPTVRWILNLDRLEADEVKKIEDFFIDQEGEFGNFTFIDPWDESEHSNCSFDQDSLEVETLAEHRSRTTLIIRKNQG